MNGIAGDGSGFFHGEAPKVERLGLGNGRPWSDGLDGVACCDTDPLGIFSALYSPFSRFLPVKLVFL